MRASFDRDRLVDFCQKWHIRRLALFGNALDDEAPPDAELDVLVTFALGFLPGHFRKIEMSFELSAMIDRRVVLRTPEELTRAYRMKVLESAQVLYQAD